MDKVSFSIGHGRTLALVGESGCGKTTTGKAIVQLLRRQAIIQGEALFDGQDLFTMEGDALTRARRSVQIVFQDPFASLDPRMRVFDILEEGLLALRTELDVKPAPCALLEGIVERVGLRRDALQRYPHEFSGGQRQRIAIARALAVEPPPDRLRRAHFGARCVGASADPQPAARTAAGDGRVLPLHHPQHRRGGVHRRRRGRDAALVASRRWVPRRKVLSRPESAYTRTLLASVPRISASTLASARLASAS